MVYPENYVSLVIVAGFVSLIVDHWSINQQLAALVLFLPLIVIICKEPRHHLERF